MKEHSQIEEMRAAIRGDRERSRARLQPSPAARREAADPEPKPAGQDEPRPGFFSSLFKHR
jgi:hypothetical protein